jgi:hypothetical protein
MHHSQNTNPSWRDGIQEGIRESRSQLATHRPRQNRSCFRKVHNILETAFNFVEELDAETQTFGIVIVSDLSQFPSSE